jgi:hypothetical protein
MSFEAREGSTNIFRNKKTKDTHPDWTGEILIDGKLKKIAMWEKQGQKGQYFSCAISDAKPKAEGKPVDKTNWQAPLGESTHKAGYNDDLESEIPFAKVPHIAAPY